MAGDFVGGLEIGLERCVLDIVLLGGAPRVDVDRNQRFGRVDHEVTARGQRDLRREHLIELGFDGVLRKDRLIVLVELHVLGVARHDHPHEVLGFAVGVLAGHEHLVDLLAVEVADGALDQRAFLVDETRRLRLQGERTDVLPQPLQILEVALDLGLGARGAGGAQDNALALRHLEVAHDVLEPLAVGGVGDLARNAAAPGGIGHQHRIAAGERQIGGEGRALVAALFLDHLHQHHLPALDHFLDLVVAA